MAAARKSQTGKVRFELTRSGIAGIAVVVFCLFLWMFLLGVWAGQSILLPAQGKKVESSVGEKGTKAGATVEKKTAKKSE